MRDLKSHIHMTFPNCTLAYLNQVLSDQRMLRIRQMFSKAPNEAICFGLPSWRTSSERLESQLWGCEHCPQRTNTRVAGKVSPANRQHQGTLEGLISYMKAEISTLHNRDKSRGRFKVEKYTSVGEKTNTVFKCLINQHTTCILRQFITFSKHF